MSIARLENWLVAIQADTPEARRLRLRIGAGTALALLFSGLLTALGLGLLMGAVIGAVALSVAGLAALRALPRLSRAVRARSASSARRSRRRAADVAKRLRPYGKKVGDGAQRSAAASRASVRSGLGWSRVQGRALARSSAGAAARAIDRGTVLIRSAVAQLEQRGEERRPTQRPHVRPIRREREAIRLNAAGTQARRNGRYAEAADLHRRALAVFQAIGDVRAAALTESNLALALSHGGDDAGAVQLLEAAAATLRGLGDAEHEGQIMANLAFVHRRQGRVEQSDNVLELALTKLSPSSPAYRAVEAELRRAS